MGIKQILREEIKKILLERHGSCGPQYEPVAEKICEFAKQCLEYYGNDIIDNRDYPLDITHIFNECGVELPNNQQGSVNLILTKSNRMNGAWGGCNTLVLSTNILNNPGQVAETISHEFTHGLNSRGNSYRDKSIAYNMADEKLSQENSQTNNLVKECIYLFGDTEINARVSGFYMELKKQLNDPQLISQIIPLYNRNKNQLATILVNDSGSLQTQQMISIINQLQQYSGEPLDKNNPLFAIVNSGDKAFKLPNMQHLQNGGEQLCQQAYQSLLSQLNMKLQNMKKRAFKIACDFVASLNINDTAQNGVISFNKQPLNQSLQDRTNYYKLAKQAGRQLGFESNQVENQIARRVGQRYANDFTYRPSAF